MKKVAYQGVPGAYSHLAALKAYPNSNAVPYPTFEETLDAVVQKQADLAIVPQENSIAGRVSEIHTLLCETNLQIVGEHFQPIHHCLLGIPNAALQDARFVHSHFQGLAQSRKNLRRLNLTSVVEANTAIAAERVAEKKDANHVAIASEIAADIYGLQILDKDIADQNNNVTRFLILARDGLNLLPDEENIITSFVFRVRNIPAALYKAMGGFATNKVNMIKLESHMADGNFLATQFYCEIEGHPNAAGVTLAMEELQFFTKDMRILGVYSPHTYRKTI